MLALFLQLPSGQEMIGANSETAVAVHLTHMLLLLLLSLLLLLLLLPYRLLLAFGTLVDDVERRLLEAVLSPPRRRQMLPLRVGIGIIPAIERIVQPGI